MTESNEYRAKMAAAIRALNETYYAWPEADTRVAKELDSWKKLCGDRLNEILRLTAEVERLKKSGSFGYAPNNSQVNRLMKDRDYWKGIVEDLRGNLTTAREKIEVQAEEIGAARRNCKKAREDLEGKDKLITALKTENRRITDDLKRAEITINTLEMMRRELAEHNDRLKKEKINNAAMITGLTVEVAALQEVQQETRNNDATGMRNALIGIFEAVSFYKRTHLAPVSADLTRLIDRVQERAAKYAE